MALTKKDLSQIGQVVDQKLEVRLKPLKKDIGKIKEDVSVMLNFLDREDVKLGKRVSRIEDSLHFSPFST